MPPPPRLVAELPADGHRLLVGHAHCGHVVLPVGQATRGRQGPRVRPSGRPRTAGPGRRAPSAAPLRGDPRGARSATGQRRSEARSRPRRRRSPSGGRRAGSRARAAGRPTTAPAGALADWARLLGQPKEPFGVAALDGRTVVLGLEPFQSELPDRLQHPEAEVALPRWRSGRGCSRPGRSAPPGRRSRGPCLPRTPPRPSPPWTRRPGPRSGAGASACPCRAAHSSIRWSPGASAAGRRSRGPVSSSGSRWSIRLSMAWRQDAGPGGGELDGEREAVQSGDELRHLRRILVGEREVRGAAAARWANRATASTWATCSSPWRTPGSGTSRGGIDTTCSPRTRRGTAGHRGS